LATKETNVVDVYFNQVKPINPELSTLIRINCFLYS